MKTARGRKHGVTINDGRIAGPWLPAPEMGRQGSLFAAFAVIAGMAIVISAGAGMVLGHLGGSMLDLSGRDRGSSRMSWP